MASTIGTQKSMGLGEHGEQGMTAQAATG